MLEKFQALQNKFNEIERQMSDPEVVADIKRYQALVIQHSELKEAVDLLDKYQKVLKDLEDAKELLSDPEMKEMAEEEAAVAEESKKELEEEMQFFLLPKDPNDNKNAIIEIRSGTGGEEAALFSGVLFSMYSQYASSRQWKIEVLSQNTTGIGGIKEISFMISGAQVFSRLKFESGIHRVQRVPATESSGRIHTSAATVAILPEAEEVDVDIDTKDLRIDVYRAQGAGGQHVNKTSSAVRITHLPTGTVVACQDQRSQFQNKERCFTILRSRLYDLQLEQQRATNADLRKTQIGSGDRSEKIRTYNYPQGRVTDHRINLTLHSLDKILGGHLDPIIDALKSEERLKKLKELH